MHTNFTNFYKKTYILFFALILFSQNLLADCVSNGTGGGDWNDPNTWLCNGVPGVPGCSDRITIAPGDVVTIRASHDYRTCSSPIYIIINGTLSFPDNGPKLRLPENSGIAINAGGSLITPASGGGSANYIEIGDNVVWSKSDGNVNGPSVLGAPIVMPIELTNFEANLENRNVVLNWITKSEINNDFFTVERSSDAINWESIATIKGAGNSNNTNQYTFTDNNPKWGIVYYRLKQTDFDDTVTFSEIKVVENDNKIGVHVFPNPSSDIVNIQYNTTIVKANVVLRNTLQQEILNVTFNNTNTFQIDVNQLDSGVYYAIVNIDENVKIYKVVVQ